MAKSPDILKSFGARVRKLRLAKAWSQEDFAHQCQLDRTYVGGIERGERNVALRNIQRIAAALGISLTELMKGL
jgi:transcriptional regulator with XRE-family HTH domain